MNLPAGISTSFMPMEFLISLGGAAGSAALTHAEQQPQHANPKKATKR